MTRRPFACHRSCDCGFGWYGHPDDPCPWCEAREQFPELPRPIDLGIDSRKEPQ